MAASVRPDPFLPATSAATARSAAPKRGTAGLTDSAVRWRSDHHLLTVCLGTGRAFCPCRACGDRTSLRMTLPKPAGLVAWRFHPGSLELPGE
jgi:hypothetical protein